jgi:hypothetical protein
MPVLQSGLYVSPAQRHASSYKIQKPVLLHPTQPQPQRSVCLCSLIILSLDVGFIHTKASLVMLVSHHPFIGFSPKGLYKKNRVNTIYTLYTYCSRYTTWVDMTRDDTGRHNTTQHDTARHNKNRKLYSKKSFRVVSSRVVSSM